MRSITIDHFEFNFVVFTKDQVHLGKARTKGIDKTVILESLS